MTGKVLRRSGQGLSPRARLKLKLATVSVVAGLSLDVSTDLSYLGATQTLAAAEAETKVQPPPLIHAKTLSTNNRQAMALAQKLNSEAISLYQQGRYTEAESLYIRSLVIKEKALGPQHPDVATSLNNIAMLYQDQGRYTEAEHLYKRSLAIREKTLGPEHPDVAISLNGMALLYQDQSRYTEAEHLLKRGLTIWEKALGPEHPDVATNLNNMASLYFAQGRYTEAEPLLKRSLTIREKKLGPDHQDVASSLNNLAVLYFAQGRYTETEPLNKRSLAILEKALGPDHPHVANYLSNMGSLYLVLGQYGQAEHLFKRSLATWQQALGPEHPDVAVSLDNMAFLYDAQGRYAEAEPLFKRSLAIREKTLGPDHPDVAISLNNMASLYHDQGRYADAEPLFKRSLAIREKALGPEHPDVATSLNNLADLYRAQGRYAEAEPLFKRGLAIWEKALGPDHPDVATSVNNRAVLYRAEGRYAEAEPLFKRSLAILEKALGPDHPHIVATLSDLSGLYYKQNRVQLAYETNGKAVDILRRRRSAAFEGSDLSGTAATMSRARGQSAERADDGNGYVFRAQVRFGSRYVESVPAERSRIAREVFIAAQDGLFSPAGQAMQQAAALRDAPEAAHDLVKAYLDQVSALEVADKAFLAAAASNAPDPERRTQLKADYDKALERLNQTEAQLRDVYPAFVDLTNPKALDLAKVQTRLAPDQAVVVMLPHRGDIYTFVVTRAGILNSSGLDWVRTEGAMARAEDRIARLACQMDETQCNTDFDLSGPGAFDFEAAYGLYQDTLAPFGAQLQKSGITRLYTVSTGALSRLPLSMWLTQAPDTNTTLSTAPWLIRSFALTVLPSVTALGLEPKSSPQTSGQPPFVGFGDPALDGPDTEAKRGDQPPAPESWYLLNPEGDIVANPKRLRALAPLAGTAEELEAIRKGLNTEAPYLRDRDTEGNFKSEASRVSEARVVSIATHGLLPRRGDGLSEPALVFTPPTAPTRRDDGLLTASEVVGLSFSAQWIILSACNTATSDTDADSLSTLARAFLFAGAQSLLASHWRVDDTSTAELISQTLTHYHAKNSTNSAPMTRSRALQAAILDLQSKPQFEHPRYWAPFSVIANQDQ